MYQMHLKIDQLPKALNVTLNRHYFKRHKVNKAWDCLIAMETARVRPPRPLEKAKLTLIRHSHRCLDFDGLVGSMKPVVDALVSAGILIDDSWAVTGPWSVQQEYRPKRAGPLLEIIIEGRDEAEEQDSKDLRGDQRMVSKKARGASSRS